MAVVCEPALAHGSRKLLGAYYTPAALVARALDGLPAPRPGARIVDLACGDGAWLAEAARRWPTAALLGVDVDGEAVEVAARRLPEARLLVGDGLTTPVDEADLVLGNPPWGAGRRRRVRRGAESASAFVGRALEVLRPGGRLCLLLPAAWLEVAAHRPARARLVDEAAVERIERLGNVFPGVFAPAALLVARLEPDRQRRTAQQIATPRGPVPQALVLADPERGLNPDLTPEAHALLGRLEEGSGRLRGRVTFILGVVTGDNRGALGGLDDEGEPIIAGPDVSALCILPPSRRLRVPLERVQQAAPRAAYARRKIVYRFIAAHPVAAVDGDGRLTLNSANALAVDDPELDEDFLAGLLNSPPIRFAHGARHAVPRLLRSHLERLPLPRAGLAEQRQIARLARAGARQSLDERIMDLFALAEPDREYLRSAWRPS
jgi:predicted RNA methylase